MLVASKDRYLPTVINTLVLSGGEYFYYVHRDVYDQAVILANKYTYDELISIVEPQHNLLSMQRFYAYAPYPINILAVFLGIVDTGLSEDMEVLTGALHVITASTNVRAYVEVNKELRKTLQFSLYIQEEYEMAWERFFVTSIPYDERHVGTTPLMLKTESELAPTYESIAPPLHYPSDHIPSETEIEALIEQNKKDEQEKIRSILQVEE